MYELILKILSFPFMKKKKNLVHILEREMHTVKAKNLYHNLVINQFTNMVVESQEVLWSLPMMMLLTENFYLFNTRTKKYI